MKKTILLLTTMLSVVASAQPRVLNTVLIPNGQDESTFPTPSTANYGGILFGTDAGVLYTSTDAGWIPNTVMVTQGPLTLYVDTLGSDLNSCTAAGTGACATPMGALKKIPNIIRHRVNISVGAGNFPGILLSGFTFDSRIQSTDTGLFITGTLGNSTLASGLATGTTTSATAVTGNAVFATLTDTTQSWTVNDLRGRFIVITGGTGAIAIPKVISSNTATVITVVGGWNSATPNGTSTYAIQDATSVLTTGIVTPTGLAGSTSLATSTSMIDVADLNSGGLPAATLLVQNFKLNSAAATTGIRAVDGFGTFSNIQMPSTSVGTLGVSFGRGTWTVTNSVFAAPINGASAQISSTTGIPTFSGVLTIGGGFGFNMSGVGNVTGCETIDSVIAGFRLSNNIGNYHGTFSLTGTRLDCTVTGTNNAIEVGVPVAALPVSVPGGGTLLINGINSNDCATILFASGPDAHVMTGVGNGNIFGGTGMTTGVKADFGASVMMDSYSATTATTDVSFDHGQYTYPDNFEGAVGCMSTGFGTRVCLRGTFATGFLNHGTLQYTTVQWPIAGMNTCGVSSLEGQTYVDVLSGGAATGKRTKLCMCTTNGSGVYAWQNVVTGTLGTTTTCGTE